MHTQANISMNTLDILNEYFSKDNDYQRDRNSIDVIALVIQNKAANHFQISIHSFSSEYFSS